MTEENLKRFREDLEKLETDVALGKIVLVSLKYGPLDGATRMVEAENGTPVRHSAYFVIPSSFEVGVPVEHAKYDWSICEGVYVYTGESKRKYMNMNQIEF